MGIGPNTTTVNMTGLLTVSGFGTHDFNSSGTGTNEIFVRNSTDGAANAANIQAIAGSTSALMKALPQSYTTSTYEVQAAGVLRATGVGGWSIAATNASGAIRFYSGGTTEVMRIHSSSYIYVINRNLLVDPSYKIFLDGGSDTYIYEAAANTVDVVAGGSGGVRLNSGATSWVASSDEHLKTPLTPFDRVSERLRGVRTGIGRYLTDAEDVRRSFFIAQDWQTSLPEAVTISPDGLLTMSYTDTLPLVVAGWQQHDATIVQLAARIAALETKDH